MPWHYEDPTEAGIRTFLESLRPGDLWQREDGSLAIITGFDSLCDDVELVAFDGTVGTVEVDDVEEAASRVVKMSAFLRRVLPAYARNLVDAAAARAPRPQGRLHRDLHKAKSVPSRDKGRPHPYGSPQPRKETGVPEPRPQAQSGTRPPVAITLQQPSLCGSCRERMEGGEQALWHRGDHPRPGIYHEGCAEKVQDGPLESNPQPEGH